MAKAKSRSKNHTPRLVYWAAGLGVLSVGALLPAVFNSVWTIPLSGTVMHWYYGAAMALALGAAVWVVQAPKNEKAAALLAVALLVLAVPGLQHIAGAVTDTSGGGWMHLASTVGPLAMLNVTAAVLGILAFVELDKH